MHLKMASSTRVAPALYVGRQPIFDRRLRVRGYELLARDRSDAQVAQFADAEQATARTLIGAFHEIGLDRLVGDTLAFVNVTPGLLVPEPELPFGPERVVLEVPATAAQDPAVLAAARRLTAEGWRLAVDGALDTPAQRELLDLAAYAKVDVGAVPPGELAKLIARLDRAGLGLIALKVETHELLDACLAAGFGFVQGFVLSRPKVVTGRGLPADRAMSLRLLADIHQPSADLEELERIVRRDVTLAYRVLRSVNAAGPALARRIDSVRDAVVLLGERRVRQWLALTVLAGIQDKPSEVLATSLVRAGMCERLALIAGTDPSAAFTVGLLSALDAILDVPMADIVAELPLSDRLNAALLEHEGSEGVLLRLAIAWEQGDLETLARPEGRRLPLLEAYLGGLAWSQAVAAELNPQDD
jgi:c-di-GMP phosphodiesterase